jgi:hypothetical protein
MADYIKLPHIASDTSPLLLSGLNQLAGFAVNLALDGLSTNSQCGWHLQIMAGQDETCTPPILLATLRSGQHVGPAPSMN